MLTTTEASAQKPFVSPAMRIFVARIPCVIFLVGLFFKTFVIIWCDVVKFCVAGPFLKRSHAGPFY